MLFVLEQCPVLRVGTIHISPTGDPSLKKKKKKKKQKTTTHKNTNNKQIS